MVAVQAKQTPSAQALLDKSPSNLNLHGPVVEEIHGLIKVYRDGHAHRPQIVPCVSPALPPHLPVTSKDVIIDPCTNVWARLYHPNNNPNPLPLFLYFHGGGFCVGSAAWACYHEFLATLAAKGSCLILSVNYRLAPENPLPAAYHDGVRALTWVTSQEATLNHTSSCHFNNNIFLGGDSAGANIAHHVGLIMKPSLTTNFTIRGTILIQPFFGGDARTASEKASPLNSALTLPVSDAYWRLSLPEGATRDHPWSNPGKLFDNNNNNNNNHHHHHNNNHRTMVCIAEMDILKDRNLEFCDALTRAGKRVECLIYNGVGHAFHVLDKTQISRTRTTQMISHIAAFIAR